MIRMNNLPPMILQEVQKGISYLKNGGIVAYPTDTVYGLGASSRNIEAVKNVYKVKNRPMNMPLPLLLADVSWIERVSEYIPEIAVPLIKAFMPGALTLIMPKSGSVSDVVSGGGSTVAVRVPAHPLPLALIEGIGNPVTGTSANISGKPSPLTAGEVREQLGDSIDFILDGGKCPGGKESTILDVTGEIPVLIREGAITKEEIEKLCPVINPREEKL